MATESNTIYSTVEDKILGDSFDRNSFADTHFDKDQCKTSKIGLKEVLKSGFESLNWTLIRWFVVLALLPMGLVALISYQQAIDSLNHAAISKLEQSAQAKADFVRNWFHYRFIDLASESENSQNSALIMGLQEGLKTSDKIPSEYVLSFDWNQRVSALQTNLTTRLLRYDYIYDIYLIDPNGNILYSVARKNDLGQNLFEGNLATSRFAKSVQNTLKSGVNQFSDLEYYAPFNDNLAGFLTSVLQDEYGTVTGVLAIQINLNRILENFNASLGQGTSEKHYLIAGDGLLRSPIDSNSEILTRSINTWQFKNWFDQHITQKKDDSRHEDHSFMYSGPDTQAVIGIHLPLTLPGIKWVLISEIDQDEALFATIWLRKVIGVLVMITALLTVALAIFQARHITRPIVKLAITARAVANGDLDQRVEVNTRNEIGQLAEAFNDMLVTRQAQEQSLKKNEADIRLALKHLEEQKYALDQHAIVSITDTQGNITFANDRACQISGYSQKELLGNNHRILSSEYHIKTFWTDMYLTITRGEVWHGEICSRAKDGHLYWEDTTIVPFIGDEGKPKSFITIRTDITERKLAEMELKQARDKAQDANRAKGEFLANMSHEIRTPMNGVIGMTNLLLDTGLNREQYGFAKSVKSSAESLLSLINDILDFSKIEAGKMELEPIDFDICSLLDEFVSTIAFRAHEKGLELICPANPVQHRWLNGDPGRIRQILTNLIGNAIKFTEQGEIAVYFKILHQTDSRTLLHIEIVDTGIGLSTRQLNNLFERFRQADGSTTRKYGGTGLGLTICKQLVELMGGDIGVNSSTGRGSAFWFTLDLANADQQPQQPILADFSDQNVLVVDDNATNLNLFGQLLTNWNVNHVLADSSEAALIALSNSIAEDQPFSIAILDKQMPGMDGAELGTWLKSNPDLTNIQLMMISSQGQRGDAKKFKEAGFSSFLSKPIDQSELYNSLLQLAGIGINNSEQIIRYGARKLPRFDARVLVVEDNTTNQTVARGMLDKFGVRVDLAGNGEEAMHMLKQTSYDLVFMDCQMPVMDGYEASRRIRDPLSPVDHDVPIIAMTANAMQGDREKCLKIGMNDYIPKPIDPDKLQQALRKWMPEKIQLNSEYKTLNEIDGVVSVDRVSDVVFDQVAFSNRMMGDDDLMHSVAEAYLADMKIQIARLEEALEAGDPQLAARLGHKIKGASANVGGMMLSAQAEKIEEAGNSGNINSLRQFFTELEQHFKTLETRIMEILV